MPIEPFVRDGFPGSVDGGVTDFDNQATTPEDSIALPWLIDPDSSWFDYRCWVEVYLDAGMALHKPLPQSPQSIDTLASVFMSDTDVPDGFTSAIGGVNVAESNSRVDIIQRMATSEWRFVLRGWSIRAGYPIPIPGLVSVGKSPAVPEGTQMAYNTIVGNLPGGIPVWYAAWRLPYVVTLGMGSQAKEPIPPNAAVRLRADLELPLAVVMPTTPADQNSAQQRTVLRGGFQP